MRFNEIKWVKLFVIFVLLIGVFYVAAAHPLPAAAGKPTSAPVQLFSDETIVEGSSSTLQRNANGVSMTLHTSGLTGGDAVTNWFVVFNNPSGCSNPCNGDDIFIDGDPVNGPNVDGIVAAEIAVLFATGKVIGQNGVGNFAAHLSKDNTSGALGLPSSPLALTNPTGAEIHIIVRTHGQMDPALMPDQINSVDGGCDPDTEEPCQDIQFSVHPAP